MAARTLWMRVANHQTYAKKPLPIWLVRIVFGRSCHWCDEWDDLFIRKTDDEWGGGSKCMCGIGAVEANESTNQEAP